MGKRIVVFNNFLIIVGVLVIFVLLTSWFVGRGQHLISFSQSSSGKFSLQHLQDVIDKVKQSTVLIRIDSFSNHKKIGSGFVFKKIGDVSFIATSRSLIEGSLDDIPIPVVLNSGTKKEQVAFAEMLAIDRDSDLAILSVTAQEGSSVLSLDNVSFGTARTKLFVFGFPRISVMATPRGNPSVTVSRCSISGVLKDGNNTRAIRFNPSLDLGNTGGPVIDSDGNLVGIVGVDFSLPTKHRIALAVPIQRLIEFTNGKIEHLTIKYAQKEKGNYQIGIHYDILDPFHNIQKIRIAFSSSSGLSWSDISTRPLVRGYWQSLLKHRKMQITDGNWSGTNGYATLIVPASAPSSCVIQPGFVSIDGTIHSMQALIRNTSEKSAMKYIGGKKKHDLLLPFKPPAHSFNHNFPGEHAPWDNPLPNHPDPRLFGRNVN